MQRVYPYWWNLAYCYGENNDKIIESFVLSTIDGNHYWRDIEKEIDFLKIDGKNIIPIEVKNKEIIEERELNTLRLFMDKYKIKKSLVLYLGDENIKKCNSGVIQFIPFWKWLLEKDKN